MDHSQPSPNPSGGDALRRDAVQPALHDDRMERVKANQGAPGIDGMRVEDFAGLARSHWADIRQALRDGTYQPQLVRGVSIPKPNGGGERLLGIPGVVDRVSQQAIAQVLTPIVEPGFSDASFGFTRPRLGACPSGQPAAAQNRSRRFGRPGRSAHGAQRRVLGFIGEGYRIAVDLDLANCFDHVQHDVRMARVGRKVRDKRLLALVGKYLRAGVRFGETLQATELGTPQGGPLSPLLANILLDDLDKELERRAHRFVRYADDRLILVKSPRAGERVMASVTRCLTGQLKRVVSAHKSRVVKTNDRYTARIPDVG